jgi:hypothetical protein
MPRTLNHPTDKTGKHAGTPRAFDNRLGFAEEDVKLTKTLS